MEFYSVLLPLALILILSKTLGIFCKKIGIPQVVAMLLSGLIIGILNMITIKGEPLLVNEASQEGLSFIAKIGVVLIMFSAGLETDLKQIKSTGVAAIIITSLGVILPLTLGFITAALLCNGGDFFGDALFSNLFYGAILTATSVSVTVATLKELGKLQSKVGTSIVSAAILDDIIGVIILSFIMSLSGDDPAGTSSSSPWIVLLLTVLFFVFVFIFGFCIRKFFAHLDKSKKKQRRIPIFGMAICFLFAYLSERVFGIADITGAYFAGLILSSDKEKDYIDRRSEIASYLIFSPVFFANIGINMDFSTFDPSIIIFGIVFIIAGLVGKLFGCGLGAFLSHYSMKDSYRVGLGMMVRAEVCLICAQKGIECISDGKPLVNPGIMPFIIVLIIFTSFVTPLLLKISYKNELDNSITPLTSK